MANSCKAVMENRRKWFFRSNHHTVAAAGDGYE
jgi:hypothetical protein